MTFALGSKEFRTKKEIQNYFKKYHDSRKVGTVLQGEQLSVMEDLIRRHPTYDEMSLPDDLKFRIWSDPYKNKTYQVRGHHEWEVFSYLKCIKGATKSKNHRSNVISAARREIRDQIVAFRKAKEIDNLYICEICGKKTNDVDIDHNFEVITFQRLLDDFLKSKKTTYDQIKITHIPTGGHVLTSPDEWATYHQENAILRCICRDCHRGKKVNVF